MSDFKNKDNTGVLFPNSYKQSQNHPDYKGTATIDGVDKEIAIWIKQGKKGEFFSISFSEPYNKEASQPARPAPKPKTKPKNFVTSEEFHNNEDDGLPF